MTNINKKPPSKQSTSIASILIANMFISLVAGGMAGAGAWYYLDNTDTIFSEKVVNKSVTNIETTDQSSAIIDVAENSIESVVSVVGIENNLEVSAGSGFIVNDQGYIITNKHVVDDSDNFEIVLNGGKSITVDKIWKDESLDLAVLKVNPGNNNLKAIQLGSSSELELGQTVVAIGNSLGEFSNSVSSGIVSGLSRRIVAGDVSGNNQEVLENVIQTDASINSGNSGGPLLDIGGKVIAVNVAKANNGENVGFAIPIEVVKPIIKSVIENDEILRPYIGVRYFAIYPDLVEENDLPVDYGAWLATQDGTSAIVAGSPAEEAGLIQGDIILEFNGEEINLQNSLAFNVRKYSVGDSIVLKILRDGQERDVSLTLTEF